MVLKCPECGNEVSHEVTSCPKCGWIMIKTLFHYTNIETLALILKNKTIRLNSLDKMDDLEENMAADLKNVGMFTYISCWTDDKDENLSLWKQYTNHDTGIRIELPVYPFKKYDAIKMIKNTRLKNVVQSEGDVKSIIRLDEMLVSNYTTQVITGDNTLYKVKYTDNEEELCPTLVTQDLKKGTTTIALGQIGKHKRKVWEYQKEWRYLIQFLPANLLTIYSDDGLTFKRVMIDIINGKAKQPFPYYDLVIDDDAFKKMKVVLSPTMTYGNEVLIRNTIEKYNPDAVVSQSKLKGKIR
uniref:zinc ribbon domain-containing protein n=1 Tax=Enterocloster aldenensis TaxID=358742 RepID=UPI0022E0F5CA